MPLLPAVASPPVKNGRCPHYCAHYSELSTHNSQLATQVASPSSSFSSSSAPSFSLRLRLSSRCSCTRGLAGNSPAGRRHYLEPTVRRISPSPASTPRTITTRDGSQSHPL